MKIYIKNMACQSCKVVVKEALEDLGIDAKKVELGEIETLEELTEDEKIALNSKIRKAGLEVLESKKGVIIEKIRKVIIEYVYHSDERPDINFSDLLSKKLHLSYGYLANLFSEVEANTIERYVILLKIERIKEMIVLEEFTLTEIAYKLHYSSVAHLSNQFKKQTGLTPSHFKKLKDKRRVLIQDL